MIRIGQMVKVKPDGLAAYKWHHANPLPGVNEMIKKCHIQNYTIYNLGDYLFASFEYVGDDIDADMEMMRRDPATQKWWTTVHPYLQPIEEGKIWSDMEEVYHLD